MSLASIAISGDISFDKTFYSAAATTWRCFYDSLLIIPSQSFLPNPETVLEETGTIDNLLSSTSTTTDSSFDTSADEGSPPILTTTDLQSPLIIDE